MTVLLIDVDGTLIDSMPGIQQSFIHALETVGCPIPDAEFLSRIAGPPMEQTLRSLGLDEPTTRRALAEYLAIYGKQGVSNSAPFAGMRDFLAAMKSRGHILATATSKGEHFAKVSLQTFDMLDFFDVFAAAQEDGPRRTKAQVIEFARQQLGHRDDPSAMLMIGDRIHDVQGAAQFGIPTVLVSWGYAGKDELAGHPVIAHTPKELETIVDEFAAHNRL